MLFSLDRLGRAVAARALITSLVVVLAVLAAAGVHAKPAPSQAAIALAAPQPNRAIIPASPDAKAQPLWHTAAGRGRRAR
jgi:hypothetical protein